MPIKIVTETETRDWLKANSDSEMTCRAVLDRAEADERLKEIVAKVRDDMKYFPQGEITAAVKRATDDHTQNQREREEEAVTERGIFLNDAQEFEATAEHARNLPDVVTAFERRGSGGTSDQAYVGLLQLDAIISGQVETRFRNREWTAAQLDAEHERLLDGDVSDPRINITLRAIETRREDLLSVVKTFDPLREPEQATALRRLRERIATAREARVPDVIRQAIAAVQTGRKELEKIRATRRLQIVSRRTLADAKKWRQQA